MLSRQMYQWFSMLKLPMAMCVLISITDIVLHAQSDLLQNPDVSWVAEAYTDYPINLEAVPEDLRGGTPWADYVVEKMVQEPTASGFAQGYDDPFAYWQSSLARMFHPDKVTAYKDPDLLHKADYSFYAQQLHLVDTVYQYDPVTLEERLTVIRQSFNPASIIGLRVRHLLYWKEKEKQLGYRLLAYAPLFLDWDEWGVGGSIHPIAWFKAGEVQDAAALRRSSDISLILEAKQGSECIDSRLQVLKGSVNLGRLAEVILHEPTSKLYNADGSFDLIGEQQLIEWREGIIDTVTTFDPVSYEETIRIVKSLPLSEVISKLGLVTRWYWDSHQLRLLYEPVGYAPLVQKQSSAGDIYYVPAVYIKY